MILTDGIHLVSTISLTDLHRFAFSIGLKKCWFRGAQKNHPHYDLTTARKVIQAEGAGAERVSTRRLLRRMVRE